ncbi:MotY family protein [Spiribacter halobius]|uniref:OmpA-like domain-containing protein n=1 Tax=Sediminicurvatus halobius TaxID=2182432 RepID=A0A2U2MZI1_9GAMM|nr:OmpA family protein [Spiribacter halobius]PWG62385.1 hypothetical protein DEM34_12225 [Spiribacter halobius]UEX79483.1 OmpA family protein [Spiribacter halobius]
MLITLWLTAILLPSAAGADGFRARLADAGWESVPGGNACHLVHRIPRLGTLILTQYRDDRLVTTFVTRRPPGADREGQLYRQATAWQSGRRERLTRVQARPERNALRFDGQISALLLEGLEAGHEMRLSFPDWQVGPLDAVVSPVAFRPALRRHLACLGAATGGDPPDSRSESDRAGDDGGGNTAAPSGVAAGAAPERRDHSPNPADLGATIRGLGGGATPIYFGHGTARLDRVDFEAIRRLAGQLRNAGHLSEITIVGHTDSTGSRGYNRALGLARAIEVRNRLIAEGVAAERLGIRSEGETAPVADNGDRYQRSRNRRAVIEAGL